MTLKSSDWNTLRRDERFARRLGNLYRALREPLGSQPGFAEMHGLHAKAIERIEQGVPGSLSLNLFSQLARAVGLTAEELVRRAQPGTMLPEYGDAAETGSLAFLRRQENEIFNVSLLPGDRVSFGFLWPDLIFEAPLRFHRHPQTKTTDDLNKLDLAHPTSAIIGGPGSGKSTALRLIALNMTGRYAAGTDSPFPLFMHASDVEAWLEGDEGKKKLIELRPEARPLARLVDGLDEIAESDRERVLRVLQRTGGSRDVTILTCRSDVFGDLARKYSNETFFDEVVEVLDWDFQRNVLPFAKAYLEKIGSAHLLAAFSAACDKVTRLRSFVCNPFHLALTIYLLTSGEALTDDLFLDRFSLYDAFYRRWIDRERRRGTASIATALTVQTHVEVARKLYGRRLGLVYPGPLIPDIPDIRSDTAFAGLFEWRYEPLSGRTELTAFRHESLLEFVLAFGLLSSMSTGDGLHQALLTPYNNDVNSFVREGLSRLQADERVVAEGRLSALLEGPHTLPHGAPRIREQAVYYLGRLGSRNCPSVLLRLSSDPGDPILRRAAALGAILYGVEDVEMRFVDELMSSQEADLLNRSIQIAYFGDVDDDLFAFQDDGTVAWQAVRRAIFERLRGSTLRDQRLRLWDLATLLSFLRSRRLDQLAPDEIATIRLLPHKVGGSPAREARLAALQNQVLQLVDERTGGES